MDVDVICRYYEPVKAPFVSATMVPAARAAARCGVRAHLERHWLHGPHVAVALHGEPGPVGVATERVRAVVADGLARRPSRFSRTAADVLAASEAAGRAELVPGPYLPVHPDNSIQVEVGDRGRLASLLGEAAVEVRAELLAGALDVIEVATASPRTSGARVQMATTAMAAHAAQYGHGVAGGYVSFLSHLEDFLFRADPTGAVRAEMDRVWLRQSEAATAQVSHAVDVGTGAAGAEGTVLGAWAAWSGTALALAADAFARGEVPLIPGDGYRLAAERFDDPELADRWSDRVDRPVSRFHQVIGPAFDVEAVAEAFGPYRFATNVLYQVLLVCDVTPLERYLAASLVARAVERLTGSDWHMIAATEGAAR